MSTPTTADLQMFERSRTPAELVTRAGVVRVTDAEARELGIKGGGDMAGIAFVYWQPASMMNGNPWKRWYLRVRRDTPDPDGKRKYVAVYGDRRHFYFPPCPQWFADVNVPIILVESEKAALALLAFCERTGRKILSVAMGGCWSWRGKVGITTSGSGERVPEHGVLPDLRICRNGRKTFVLLDANAATNEKVAAARAALVRQLHTQRAAVAVLDLPMGSWNGPDDFIGAEGDEAMARLIDGADEGARILDDIRAFVHRFVVITPAQGIAIALWVAHTFCFRVAPWIPILAVTSATKRAGKTRVLEVLGYLVHEPWNICGATAASLFRMINDRRPTVLLDEVDALVKGNPEMFEAVRGVLNSGCHHKGQVPRCVVNGANVRVVNFSTFAPKAVGGIGRLPDTVADRSLHIRLERKLQTQRTERLRERVVAPRADELRTRLTAWIQKQLTILKHADPVLPDHLNDRQQDVCELLFAIADAAGGTWPTEAREAITELCTSREAQDESIHVQLLTDLKVIFDEKGERVFSSELVGALIQIETSPWAEWRHGRPMTKVQLARQLREFKISPGTIRIEDETQKGYKREQFESVWERYLPPDSPVTPFETSQPSQSSIHTGPDHFSERHTKEPVTDRKSAESPVSTRVVTPVTDQKGGGGEPVCGKCHPDPNTPHSNLSDHGVTHGPRS